MVGKSEQVDHSIGSTVRNDDLVDALHACLCKLNCYIKQLEKKGFMPTESSPAKSSEQERTGKTLADDTVFLIPITGAGKVILSMSAQLVAQEAAHYATLSSDCVAMIQQLEDREAAVHAQQVH